MTQEGTTFSLLADHFPFPPIRPKSAARSSVQRSPASPCCWGVASGGDRVGFGLDGAFSGDEHRIVAGGYYALDSGTTEYPEQLPCKKGVRTSDTSVITLVLPSISGKKYTKGYEQTGNKTTLIDFLRRAAVAHNCPTPFNQLGTPLPALPTQLHPIEVDLVILRRLGVNVHSEGH